MVKDMMKSKRLIQLFLIFILVIITLQEGKASDGGYLSSGQTVYVPVYSNVISGPREVPVHLSNTLIIRNTDLHNEIHVIVADYYDTKGRLIRNYYKQPIMMGPLETVYLYLSERDQEGGVGANFIIEWQAEKKVNLPIIECVMVGSQGRAFVSPSHAIEKDTK